LVARAERVFDTLPSRPPATIAFLAARTAASVPPASRAVESLSDLGSAKVITGRKRQRVFASGRDPDILNEGTEPL
jgi:hypothetical protein